MTGGHNEVPKAPTASAQSWREFTNRLGDVGDRIHALADSSRTPHQHGEINQALLWTLSAGALFLAQMDPDYPDWLPQANSANLTLCTSPDNSCYITRIRGSGVYRIRGKRGTVRRIELTVQKGFIGFTDQSPNLTSLTFDDMHVSTDGAFELVLSASRPNGYDGNWLEIDATVDNTFLFVRQVSYDRANEEDGYLTIQRIDRPIDQPRRRDEIDKRLHAIPDYVEKIAMTLMALLAKQYPPDHKVNRVENITPKIGDQSTVRGQVYYAGEIVLSAEEALIVEFEKPKDCPYWNTQLVDSFFNALDFMFHQSELNSERVHVDPDNKIRIVVSEKDPGVANWLDKGDYEQNVLRFRWLSGDAPVPTSRKVAFTDVSKFLHPQTPRISYEQRQNMLRERIEDIQRRRRW